MIIAMNNCLLPRRVILKHQKNQKKKYLFKFIVKNNLRFIKILFLYNFYPLTLILKIYLHQVGIHLKSSLSIVPWNTTWLFTALPLPVKNKNGNQLF